MILNWFYFISAETGDHATGEKTTEIPRYCM